MIIPTPSPCHRAQEPLDSSDKGYQPPIDESLVKEFDPEDTSRRRPDSTDLFLKEPIGILPLPWLPWFFRWLPEGYAYIYIYIYTDTHTDTHTQTRHNGLYLWYNAHLPKTGFIIWFSVFIALTFAEWQGIASLIFAGHDERQGPRRRHFERHLGSTCERGGWLMMIGRFFLSIHPAKKIGWFTMGTVVGSTAEKQE